MNLVRLLAALILIAVLCAACAAHDDGYAVEPMAAVPGYYGAGQTLGGGAAGGAAAVEAVEVEERLEDTLITIKFDGGTPVWRVDCLEAPGRIVLSVNDCALPDMLPAAEGRLMGAFIDGGGRLILQFTGEIAYKAEEKDGLVVLTVRRELKDAREWFVLIDAFDGGAEPLEGYNWALNADMSTLVLLSPPMETQADAQAALAGLPVSVPRVYARVVRVEDGRLPPSYVEDESAYYEAYTTLTLGDMEIEGRVWGVGMRFLCWQRASGMALVARTVRMFGETHDELWLADAGERRALLTHEWTRIESAAYSRSERFIAIIEAVEGMRLLYIYDTRNDALHLMIEEGLGTYTASYAWYGDKLYVLSGDEELQLMVVDPSLEPDDRARVTALREQPEPFNAIEAANGALYYADQSEGGIYALDLATLEASPVTEGDQFVLSPDGKHMAVFYYEPVAAAEDGEEQDGDEDGGVVMERTGLKLVTLETGEFTEVSSGALVTCVAFSRDGQMLHYGLEGAGDGEGAPYRLYTRRLGEDTSIEQGAMHAAEFYAGSGDDTIVAVGYYRAELAYRAITFELSIIR